MLDESIKTVGKMNKEAVSDLCKVATVSHHYHSANSVFYCGSSYLSVCCHCGRVQLIVYRSRQENPELVPPHPGSDCGAFVK